MAQRATGQGAKEIMTERELAKAGLAPERVETGKEIATRPVTYSSEALRSIETWDDLTGLFETAGVEVELADKVLGDGFSILSTEEKTTLIGVPLALLEWRFNDGNMGRFVSIRAIAKTGPNASDIKRVIINDGSTGILRQLDEFTTQTGKMAGLLVKKGLRVSEYNYEDKDGVQRPAKTFYFDASA